jgi:hypothetical protein
MTVTILPQAPAAVKAQRQPQPRPSTDASYPAWVCSGCDREDYVTFEGYTTCCRALPVPYWPGQQQAQ